MTTATTEDNLSVLRNAIAASMRPFCVAGDIPLASHITMTILPEEGQPQATQTVKFPPPSPDALAPLIDACKRSSFGRGKEEVMDPEYRQALVLHKDRFGIIPHSSVDPLVQGIIPAIQHALYPATEFGAVAQRRIVAELDKLNVYGEGDFFKGHVDTPRSSDMFGTLLINLPVKHEGGALVVYAPDGHPEAAESRRTNWGSEESLGWIAFFSDCPTKSFLLQVVIVTLTYNLSIVSASSDALPAPIIGLGGAEDAEFRRILTAIAATDVVNEEHPRLRFHLEHRYPADINHNIASTALPILKGCDATVYRAFISAGLDVTSHYVLISRDNGHPYFWFTGQRFGLTDRMPTTIGGSRYDYYRDQREGIEQKAHILPPEATVGMYPKSEGGIESLIYVMGGRTPDTLNVLEISPPKDLAVGTDVETDADTLVGTPFKFLAHGNEPSIAVDYASICIIGARSGQGVDWAKRW